jgi:hypothetical protein
MQQLLSTLNAASVEHREVLRKIIDAPGVCDTPEPAALVKGIRWLNRTLAEDFRREVFEDPESYRHILRSTGERLALKQYPWTSEPRLEEAIVRHTLQGIWDKLTPLQRRETNSILAEVAASHGTPGSLLKAGGYPLCSPLDS